MHMNCTMKVLSLLALFVGSTTAANVKPSFKNGKNCSLEVNISCEVDVGIGEKHDCKNVNYDYVFDISLCDEGPQIWVATYTIEYSNNNSNIDRDIVFFKGVNPESNNEPSNPYTFARANGKSIGIQKKKKMPRNASRKFTAKRYLDLCGGTLNPSPMRSFVAEVQLNGFMSGKKRNTKFQCSARDFYRHQVYAIA